LAIAEMVEPLYNFEEFCGRASMKILLVYYKDDELGAAFRKYFETSVEVEIVESDICKLKCDAIVSPANSFGFMDGGIDAYYSFRFGSDLQGRLQAEIRSRPLQELLIGEAVVISTCDSQIPWLISAPTMRVPCNIENTINPYLAMKAIITVAKNHRRNPPINSIAIPGLGTGTGKMNKSKCSFQMFRAFEETFHEKRSFPLTLSEIVKENEKLLLAEQKMA